MDNYSYEIRKIFKEAENEMLDLHHPYVGSEHLLLSIIKNSKELSSIIKFSYNNIRKELLNIVGKSSKKSIYVLYTPLLKRIIDNANSKSKELKVELSVFHLLSSILEEKDCIAYQLLESTGIKIIEVKNLVANEMKKSVTRNSLVYEIGYNLNEKVNAEDKVINRDKELNTIMEVLMRKSKNNPLLIGDAGVGKTAIVEELARKINSLDVPRELRNKTIIVLEMGSLISGTKYRGEFEERLNKIIKEIVTHDDIILFIDEIHTLVNAGGAEGAIDAANILKPYLARGSIKVIGATTIKEYQKYIENDKALERRFHKIVINEPNKQNTKEILKTIKTSYEKHHNVIISDETIDFLVDKAEKYVKYHHEPDRSIDILDSVCSRMKLNRMLSSKESDMNKELMILKDKKNKYLMANNYKEALSSSVLENDIENLVTESSNLEELLISENDILNIIEINTGIPLNNRKSELNKAFDIEIKNNLDFEDQLNNLKNIILENDDKSILLSGNDKERKNKLIDILKHILDINFIKLDMNEYNSETSLTKLIGTSAGYVGYKDECVFDSIKAHPFSLIYIENIDKSISKIKNIFKQILENKYITNSTSEKIYFDNVIIIASSSTVLNRVGFISDERKNSVLPFSNIINMTNSIIYKNV